MPRRKVETFFGIKEKFLELNKVKSTMAGLKYGFFLRDGFFIFCTALSVILDWEFDTYIVVTLEFISNSPGFLWYFLNHLKCGINIWDFARPFLQRLFLTVCNHWSLCFHNLYLGNILVEISFNATSYNRTNKPKKKKKAKETDSVTSPSLCKFACFL